jgi:hypothetical protein
MSDAGPSTQTPPVVEAGQGKKRKRTGKEREERKQAAILAVRLSNLCRGHANEIGSS